MKPTIRLSARDQAMLNGELGAAPAFSMRIMARFAAVMGADELIDISSAHIDGCLYHGQTSLDFVEKLVADGGKVLVPTTLNVGSLDLIHPELFQGDPHVASAGKRLMDAHVELGCEATFTCAPYQARKRPKLGDQIVWAESNAIVFANSVLGARTNRYGDFIDLCAAITGRAPHVGLHKTANRRGQIVFRLQGFSERLLHEDMLCAVLGYFVGARTGNAIAVIDGLARSTNEDQLKAFGAAAASTGSVALFHAVGITPEAPTLREALQGQEPEQVIDVTPQDLWRSFASLSRARPGGALTAVCLGTPHFSLSEFELLHQLLQAYSGTPRTEFFVSTSRYIMWELEQRGLDAFFAARGITLVLDTCTYVSPVLRNTQGVVMTNSAKWAHYAPGNIGVDVAFGSMAECVRSAYEGQVWHDGTIWS